MNNRRNFLKKVAVGSAVFSFFAFPKKTLAKNEPIKNALLHHVYFWLNNPDSSDERKQFERAISELIKIETINKSHFGKPASTEKRDVVDHSYSYSLLLIFDSKEDQDIYQKHPIHEKFVAENGNLWKKVIVYDSVDINKP